MVPPMRWLLVLLCSAILIAAAVWGSQKVCGRGTKIAKTVVLWSDQRVLVFVNSVSIRQETTNLGAVRQNLETWLGGLIHPTATNHVLHVFCGQSSGLKSTTLDLAAPDFWLWRGGIYTWNPGSAGLLKWNWVANTFAAASPKEVHGAMSDCSPPGSRCDLSPPYPGEKQAWERKDVLRGFNGAVEMSGGQRLSFLDKPSEAYRISFSHAGRDDELLSSPDAFTWQACGRP